MRLLMAQSFDGFFARSTNDDMAWTGQAYRAVFRLLTSANRADVILAGATTFSVMSKLPGRHVIKLSRSSRPRGMRLSAAGVLHPDALVIGGPTIAEEALRLGLIDRAFMCVLPTSLHEGLSAGGVNALLPYKEQALAIKIEDVVVQMFTIDGHGSRS